MPNNKKKDMKDPGNTTKLDGLLEDLELAEQKALERQSNVSTLFEELVPWVIEFRVIGTPEIIRAPIGERLTLGRDDSQNDIYPEIDLTPFRGQHLGVSRKHARIIMRNNRITVEDLQSANGTYINGKHIGVLNATRLRDGDQLKLGSLSLQVHFVIQPHSEDDTMHGLEDNLNIPLIGNRQRVLVLDDNKEVCAVVRLIAIKAGFLVSVAHDVSNALRYLDSGEIDAILVELMLEDSNSLDLVDYVRQNSEKYVPIIATSSTGGGYRENQARAKGVDDLLEKPLSVDSILNALKKFANALE